MKRPLALNLRHVTLALSIAAILHGAGCADEPDSSVMDAEEMRIRSAEQYGGGGGDPGTHNHFRPKCFWDHSFQQTARDLSRNAITNVDGKLQQSPYLDYLLDPSCRQEALEILVGCALKPGQTVVDGEDGGKIYEGELGFAQDWTSYSLTTHEKEWLTGCMLERLNAFGREMSIYIYAPTYESADQDGLILYPVTESQAWGNLFDSTVALNPTHDPYIPERPPFEAYVCQESGLYTCTVAGEVYTTYRICDNNTTNCGLQLVGPCDSLCPHGASSLCDTWDNRMYSRTPDDSMCDVPSL